MPIDCEQDREHIDAYALGALDDAEKRELEAHLVTCDECPPLVDAARETASSIAMAVPFRAANSSLKAKVMAGAAVLDGLPQARPAPVRRWSAWQGAAAAAIVAGIGLVAWGVYNQNQINNLEDENARIAAGATEEAERFATANTQLVQAFSFNQDLMRSQDAVTDIVDQPDAAKLTMEGAGSAPNASGRYVWSRTVGMGSLVARGLPQLAPGKTYCLWVIYESDWVVGGTFTVDETGTGRLIVEDLDVSENAGRLQAFEVSIEPAGEITKQTGETVLRADIQ